MSGGTGFSFGTSGFVAGLLVLLGPFLGFGVVRTFRRNFPPPGVLMQHVHVLQATKYTLRLLLFCWAKQKSSLII
jgi:hypothetical protein